MKKTLAAATLAALLCTTATAVRAVAAGADDDPAGRLALAEAVLKGFANFDSDADGSIAKSEFPLESLFDQLDGDGDGVLTKVEVEQAIAEARHAADLERLKREAAKNAKKKDLAGGGKPGAMGTLYDEDGKVDPEIAKRLMDADARWNPEVRMAGFLRNFDRNPTDGKVSKAEYVGGDGDQVFRRYDRTRDGLLEERELIHLMKAQLLDLERDRRAPRRNQILLLFDIDNNRIVTRAEWIHLRGPAASFIKWDIDEDGSITDEEARYPDRVRARMRGADAAASAAVESRSIWDLYDENEDRRISPEEFGGGEAVFRRLDRNGDGWITAADG